MDTQDKKKLLTHLRRVNNLRDKVTMLDSKEISYLTALVEEDVEEDSAHELALKTVGSPFPML